VTRSQYAVNLSDDERRRLEFLAAQEAKAKGLRPNQVAGADVLRGLLMERSDALGFTSSSGNGVAG